MVISSIAYGALAMAHVHEKSAVQYGAAPPSKWRLANRAKDGEITFLCHDFAVW